MMPCKLASQHNIEVELLETDPRLLRSTESLLDSLQQHSFKLRRCLGKIEQEPQQYKELATLLRTLVCYSGKTEGIVWRLTKHLGIDEHVYASAHVKAAVPTALKGHLEIAVSFIQHSSNQANKRSLRKIIKTEIAIQTQRRELTYERFIRLIAEEVGLAHEADKLSPETVLLLELTTPIAKLPTALLLLKNIGWLVVELAERILKNNSYGIFQRVPQDENDGNFSIVLAVRHLTDPHSVAQAFRFDSLVYSVSFIGSVTQDGLRLQFTYDSNLSCINIPRPSPCDDSGKHLYALCYSSRAKKLKWLTPSASGLPTIADLGWLDVSAFSTMIGPVQLSDNITFANFVVFSVLLSSTDLRRMCTAPPDSNLGLTVETSEIPESRDFP